MKKTVSIILCIAVLLMTFSCVTFAENSITEHTGKNSTVGVTLADGTWKKINLVRSEYYQKNYNTILEKLYANFSANKLDDADWFYDEISDNNKIGKNLYENIKNNDNSIYYLNIYLAYNEDFSAEKNTELLSSMDGIDEVIYTGNTTPCVIVTVKSGDDIDKIIGNENTEYIHYSFDQIVNVGFIPEGTEKEYTPSSADARKVLRYAAGLEDLSDLKKFFVFSDTDLNGKITAADARTALRIAARLEKGNTYHTDTDTQWNF